MFLFTLSPPLSIVSFRNQHSYRLHRRRRRLTSQWRQRCTCWTTASQTSITLGNKLRSKRSQGELSESSDTICARFSTPMDNKTFFSPIDTSMMSDTYPPKVDCILKITGWYFMWRNERIYIYSLWMCACICGTIWLCPVTFALMYI